jgi:energy-converting hydrogenase Eha subunit C
MLIRNFAMNLYLKIAEPRVIRIMLFWLYVIMLLAGLATMGRPPSRFEGVLGVTLVFIFAGFIFIGALFALVAVLPGFWWLERVGLILLISGMGIYSVAIVALGASIFSTIISIAFALAFAVRFQEIRRYQLAPLEPKER